ncbi:MAG: M50 family metallopeptidase [Candidatus Omnitrophica bacterium]|nr:M50 family metallopeptidase [Candidatus Omnitrophota bacterium]
MWLRVLKFILGILLIPFCFGTTVSLYHQISKISSYSTEEVVFLWGVVLYIVMHIFIFKPQRIYVFGHEMVHALFSWLSGGKIKKIKISDEGGEVKTDKINFLTLIAPYIFPTYTLLFSILFFVFDASYKLDIIYLRLFLFLLGFSLTMHILMTAETLRRIQPDLIQAGYLFSIVLIYLVNISLMAFVLSRIFSYFSFSSFFNLSLGLTRNIFSRILNQLFAI